MPGAGWHPRSRVQDALKNAHTSIQVQPEQPGIPCAMVLRLMPRSPWRRIPLASIAGELAARIARLGFANLRRLDTSHGCQDHTVLPYANAPLVWRAGIAHGKTRPAIPDRAPGAVASIAARPNVRDDRDTPLLRAGMAGFLEVIWVSREADSFFAQDWTGQISLKGLRNFLFWRSGSRPSW
jgi:hypothetical protein